MPIEVKLVVYIRAEDDAQADACVLSILALHRAWPDLPNIVTIEETREVMPRSSIPKEQSNG